MSDDGGNNYEEDGGSSSSITWICSSCGKYQGDGPFYMTSGLLCDRCKKGRGNN